MSLGERCLARPEVCRRLLEYQKKRVRNSKKSLGSLLVFIQKILFEFLVFPPSFRFNKIVSTYLLSKISPKGWSPMTEEYLDLKMDFMFKQLFGHPSRK
jgi:hypothetical protein